MGAKLMPDEQLRQIYLQALEQNRFELHYQRICHMRRGNVVGYEALLRWPNSKLGPAEFLPPALQLGIMPNINKWVIDKVAYDLNYIPDYWVAINISELKGLPEQIAAAADAGLDRSRLRLEIVESLTLDVGAISTLASLRDQGTKLEWDDWGTAYNGLKRMLDLQADALKLDLQFVRGVTNCHIKQAICNAGLSLCQDIGLESIAEGVENYDDREWIIQRGCNLGQGFLFGKPEPLRTKSPG